HCLFHRTAKKLLDCFLFVLARCPTIDHMGVADLDHDRQSYDGRVLETFVDIAGRLMSIPVQHKKRLAVLRWIVEDFQPGRLYPEEEVNRIIARRHPDFAS